MAPHWPAAVEATMLVGQVMVQATLVVLTITENVQELVLPEGSVARQFTVVVPSGNRKLGGGEHWMETTGPGMTAQLSEDSTDEK